MPTADGDPLSALRDIHLPPEPAFWPPAPGWWIVALLMALLAGASTLWGRRVARRRRPRREALRALGALREALAAGEAPHRVAAESASLLRRVALSRYPRSKVGGLTGKAWLEFLDAHGSLPGSGGLPPRSLEQLERWIPACAGMTKRGTGMAERGTGTTDTTPDASDRHSRASGNPRKTTSYVKLHTNGPGLSSTEAELLVTAPYASRSDAGEAARVIELCERWIRTRA